jgi:hypothetical protein
MSEEQRSLNEQIDAMSVQELRSFITRAGMTFADCIEKSELQARARAAVVARQEAAGTS